MKTRVRSPRGFTLIELIIAIMLLAFVSIFTAESIRRGIQTKAKMQNDIDKNTTVRDALRIIERDINMAFNYHDPYIELFNQAQDERLKRAQASKTPPTPAGTPAAGGAIDPATGAPKDPNAVAAPDQPIDPTTYQKKTEKRYTQFIGDPDALSLTTLSNIRMMENSPISTQAEVGYKLKPCRRRTSQDQTSNCLWRRVSNYIHDDITKDGQETVLLENVTSFKLRYLGPGKEEEWVEHWFTNERGDETTKDKFPYAVEVTLAVKDQTSGAKDKELRMTMVASVRNPNNPPVANPNNPNDPNNPNNLNNQQITNPGANGLGNGLGNNGNSGSTIKK